MEMAAKSEKVNILIRTMDNFHVVDLAICRAICRTVLLCQKRKCAVDWHGNGSIDCLVMNAQLILYRSA